MLEIHKNIVLDESQRPIAVQIPIEEFERLEEVIENYGLAKLWMKYPVTNSFQCKRPKAFINL